MSKDNLPAPAPTPPSNRRQGKVPDLPIALKPPAQVKLDAERNKAAAPPAAIMTASEELIQKRLHVGLPSHGEVGLENAKKFADELALKLLPDAMAEIAWDLRAGDKKDRIRATEQILDMNNMRRRDVNQGIAPTIILNLGGKQSANVPWLTKEVAEAVIVPDTDEED